MALVLGSIGAGVILLVSMYISIIQISADILYLDRVLSDEPYELAEKEEGNAIIKEPEGGGKEPEADVPWPGDDQEEEYEEPDEQYYDFHNEIKTNLSYQIEIVDFDGSVDENGLTYIYGNYPLVTCEDKNKEERINSAIQEEMQIVSEHVSFVGEELPEDMYFIFEMESYVTYMDEEKISVVVKHSFYEKKSTIPRVEAITLNVSTGEVISHKDLAEIDDELVWQFRSRNTSQNGTVEFVDDLSDEELAEYLKDEENSVMFYTPVGLEIGFNYDGGWVTVTLKTDTL